MAGQNDWTGPNVEKQKLGNTPLTFNRPQNILMQSVQIQKHIFDAALADVPADVVELEEPHHGHRLERLEDHVQIGYGGGAAARHTCRPHQHTHNPYYGKCHRLAASGCYHDQKQFTRRPSRQRRLCPLSDSNATSGRNKLICDEYQKTLHIQKTLSPTIVNLLSLSTEK